MIYLSVPENAFSFGPALSGLLTILNWTVWGSDPTQVLLSGLGWVERFPRREVLISRSLPVTRAGILFTKTA
ncbi:hypothetical protein GCM10009414_26890 [Tatumella terrea]